MLEILFDLVVAGFLIGVVLAVVAGAIKIGWQLAPYIFIGAALVWFFGG
jgi:hypothetical protein